MYRKPLGSEIEAFHLLITMACLMKLHSVIKAGAICSTLDNSELFKK